MSIYEICPALCSRCGKRIGTWRYLCGVGYFVSLHAIYPPHAEICGAPQ